LAKRIFVFDDDQMILEAIATILEDIGHQVNGRTSGQLASPKKRFDKSNTASDNWTAYPPFRPAEHCHKTGDRVNYTSL
jgi:CheY-like chemotaxis protein